MNTQANSLHDVGPGDVSRTATRRRLLPELEQPGDIFANLGPNWYASVMGTGVLATAAALLPVTIPGLRSAAIAIWVASSALLVLLSSATIVHWFRHYDIARRHALNPAMAPFFGAPPLAILTVGAATLLVGNSVIGERAAVLADSVLWGAGTLIGLSTTVAITVLMFTRHDLEQKMTTGTWLMPVVPPMVSATTGAALIPHVAAGQARADLLFGDYAMFGIALIASLIVISLIWARLAYHGPGTAETVPTIWIVLGPLGQSVAAANLLGEQAKHVVDGRYADALHYFGLIFGVPVWGFGMLWLTIAIAITVDTARKRLPFTLGWWSFTFPVGSMVAGTAELAVNTHLTAFNVVAVALYALLVAAWAIAAVNTARGSISGRLFLRPGTATTPQAVLAEERRQLVAA